MRRTKENRKALSHKIEYQKEIIIKETNYGVK